MFQEVHLMGTFAKQDFPSSFAIKGLMYLVLYVNIKVPIKCVEAVFEMFLKVSNTHQACKCLI